MDQVDMARPDGPGSREPSPDGLGPSGFDPSRDPAVLWQTGQGWQPLSDHPLVRAAFDWADATQIGRGSGAYGFFVRAYLAGATRSDGGHVE